jgi:prevent-host-death family protein
VPKEVDVEFAQSHLSALLEEAERGEEIVIARHGKPVAKLVPVVQPPLFGQDRGKIWIADDFDEPDEEIIRLFEGEEGEFD